MGVVDEITGVRDAMARCAAEFDPALVTVADATTILREATRIKHMASTVETLAARQAADGHEWRRAGHRNSAEWIARQTGVSVGQARDQLDTAARRRSCRCRGGGAPR